jgi:hypothetical protein
MKVATLLACLALAACSGTAKKDYDTQARCQDLGNKPGTTSYDQCVKDEKAAKMLKEQREEFERMRQERDDQRLRRY